MALIIRNYIAIVSLLLFALTGASSCITEQCSGAYPLYVSFSGYDADTLLPIVMSRCSGAWTNVLERDTFYITDNYVYACVPDDTAFHYERSGFSVYGAFEWEIFIPSTGKRDRISGISTTSGSVKEQWNPFGMAETCYNVCSGYYLNGIYVSTGYNEPTVGQQVNSYLTLTKN